MKKMSLLFGVMVLYMVFASACSSSVTEQQDKRTEETEEAVVKKQDQNVDQEDKENHEADDKAREKKEKVEKDPKYEISDQWSVVPIDDADEQVVLLTFDDAPDEHAVDIAKTLKGMDAKAIFFVNGHFLESDEKKKELKEIHDMGFMIGNHTYNHEYLPDLSKEEQKKEIVQVDDMVEDIIGEKPKFFRAPNGANTGYSEEVVDDEGMILMNWSYGYDWNEEYQNKDAISDIMVNTDLLANGSNLLMHDRKWTSKAIEDIVEGLRDKGYEMVDPKQIKTK